MIQTPFYIKDPDAKLDYLEDWGPWLALRPGDTIDTSTWDVPTGLTKTAASSTDTTTTVWVEGGTVGETYVVTNHVVTAQGRINDQSIKFLIQQR